MVQSRVTHIPKQLLATLSVGIRSESVSLKTL
jgi:hypothetical protein